MKVLEVIYQAIMAGGTPVFESITDRVILVVTEVASEGVHVQVIEGYTQNRPVFIHEREGELMLGSGGTSR